MFTIASHLSCTSYPPTILEKITIHLDTNRNHHLIASAACLCAPHCMPTSVTMSRDYVPTTPFPPLACSQAPVRTWGVLLLRVPTHLCAPSLPSLSDPHSSGIFWCLVFCWVDFCARARGQGASTPWQSLAPVLTPPDTWPCRRRSG